MGIVCGDGVRGKPQGPIKRTSFSFIIFRLTPATLLRYQRLFGHFLIFVSMAAGPSTPRGNIQGTMKGVQPELGELKDDEVRVTFIGISGRHVEKNVARTATLHDVQRFILTYVGKKASEAEIHITDQENVRTQNLHACPFGRAQTGDVFTFLVLELQGSERYDIARRENRLRSAEDPWEALMR